ncbi:MAG: N-acetyl-gamma-glutamyl-phosphate reductase, partial [Aquificaceae bacterium]|nr:N-acetyl-gamma-glutamyl-phosphate reductase [Aquificaceae bacterium]
LNHPHVKVSSLTSQSYFGKKLYDVFPHFEASPIGHMYRSQEPEEDFDVACLCLPHEASLELFPQLLKKGKKVIDISCAYRIKNIKSYPEY